MMTMTIWTITEQGPLFVVLGLPGDRLQDGLVDGKR
jgi:hypothetical protein